MNDQVITAIYGLFGVIIGALITSLTPRLKFKIDKELSIAETNKLNAETKKYEAETEKTILDSIRDVKQTVIDEVEDVKQDFEEFRSNLEFEDYRNAFNKLQEIIEEEIKSLELENREPIIKLKHLAVSMYYSWQNFIDLSIRKILEDNPKAKIELRVAFVDHEFLEKLNVSSSHQNWAEVSKQRQAECITFSKFAKKSFPDRLIFQAKTYSNLPHWHGWLVNDEHLLLGRTKWKINDGQPRLKVGQNEYRYFHLANKYEGAGRVEIFKQWFDYYFEYACTKKLVNCEDWLKCA